MTVANTAANAAAGVANTATSKLSQGARFAFRNWSKLTVAAIMVAGASLAMQPALAATVAANAATIPAATNLTSAVGASLSTVGSAVGTGLANSGPVWSAAWGGISAAGTGAYDWWSTVDFTPGK